MKRKKVREWGQILPGGDSQIKEDKKNEKKTSTFVFSRLAILPMFI